MTLNVACRASASHEEPHAALLRDGWRAEGPAAPIPSATAHLPCHLVTSLCMNKKKRNGMEIKRPRFDFKIYEGLK